MEGSALPIIYVDKEELHDFYVCNSNSKIGYSCEWESEQVVHLHVQKPLHLYGKTDKVLFLKDSVLDSTPQDFEYVVSVSLLEQDIIAKVFIAKDGKFEEHTPYYIPSKNELYSRNKGILEINILEKKRVMIVGLGSFGSQIAIELAKAGVGSFALMDFDRVELHNLARHTCTTRDLGRLKTDAIYDAILGKNPYAHVDKYPININDDLTLLYQEVAKADLVICATDNNQSRFNLSEALVKEKKVGIFGRAVTRAEGGDVFRYTPGGPCYCCLIGTGFFDAKAEEITDVMSARRSGRIAAYVSEEDADAMVQVGLSADIEPITNLMVKLSLMELSRGEISGISSLENELVYDYYMWANRRERRHANWAPMPNAGNKPTILRWYGARIQKVDDCPICSHKEEIALDLGEDYEEMVGEMSDMKDFKFE